MAGEEGQMVVALEEARRALDVQHADFTSSRDLAVSLLSMGALSAAFIGGLSIRDSARVDGWTWVGVSAFALMAVVATIVLWPRKTVFQVSAVTLVKFAEAPDATGALPSADKVRRDLSLWLDRHRVTNARTVKALNRLRSVMAVLLVIEIAALLLDLRGR